MGTGGCCIIKTKASVVLLAVLAAVLVAACACGDDGEEPSPSPTGVATPTPPATPGFPFEGPIGIDLTTFGAFPEQGKPVQLGITVAVRDPMTLYYRTSQRYDLAVIDSEGQEVWRWSRDRTFAQVTAKVALGANETISFAETWHQVDNDGQEVPPGEYKIVAESSHCDADHEDCGQLTTSATIRIQSSQGEP